MKEEIEKALAEIRPYIAQHLGDIEFVRFEEGTAYVKMLGTCTHCPLSEITLKAGVEELLKERVRGVDRVEAI
ncbi:MAG: NifU family protein [Candidatus Sungbacteria bacterium]|nr:NifU family protein [Candidatus Sungbacteria bacterium]